MSLTSWTSSDPRKGSLMNSRISQPQMKSTPSPVKLLQKDISGEHKGTLKYLHFKNIFVLENVWLISSYACVSTNPRIKKNC